MGPVEEEPMVKGAMLVVANTPLPVRDVATLVVLPEILAVGVPAATLRKANFADAVLCPPTRRSMVEFMGNMAPLALVQRLVAPLAQVLQVGVPDPPEVRH